MKTMYVYILECADETFYTGVTNNMERRLEEHQTGIHPESYTFSRRPVKLMFHELFNDPLSAIAFEKKIKKWSSLKKKALIENNFGSLPGLSKKKFNRKK